MWPNKNTTPLGSTVIINDSKISQIAWKDSAVKNFEPRAIEFMKYIVGTLNGQKDLPLFISNDNKPPYHRTASATAAVTPEYAESRYRDSCFRIFPESETIEFFHLGYIKNEKKYQRKSKEIEDEKKRSEQSDSS